MTHSSQSHSSKIYSFVNRSRQQIIAILSITGLITLLVAGITIILLCAGVISLFPFAYAGILFSFLLYLTTGYLVFNNLYLPLSQVSVESCALSIEQENSFLNNSLINALQLSDKKISSNNKFSPDLIQSLLDETVSILSKIQTNSIIPKKPLIRELVKLSFVILVVFSAGSFSPSFLPKAVYTLLHPVLYFTSFTPSHLKNNKEPEFPKVGDIQLTYTYPTYTDMPPLLVKNSSGDINTLKGTEVLINAKVSTTTDSALISFGTLSIPMKISGRQIEGHLILLEKGNYSILATSPQGATDPNLITHTISITNDSYPQITLLFPEDMTEIKTTDKIEIQYSVDDDFKLTKIELVYRVEEKDGSSNKKGTITIEGPFIKKERSTYLWNVAFLGLSEGGVIKYFLRVFDNDTISGPKSTESALFSLKIYDSEKGHSDVIFSQEKILEELLLLLADKLETPLTTTIPLSVLEQEKEMDERMAEVILMIDALIESLQDDPLSSPSTSLAYKAIKTRLSRINTEKREQFLWFEDNIISAIDQKTVLFIIAFRDKEVAEIETDVIEMDRLIKSEKINSLHLQEDNLMDAQDSFLDLLSSLSDMNEKEALEKLKESLQRIEELLNEFMERMASLSKELPDEFVNSEAFKEMNGEEVKDTLQEIKNALKNNDLTSATALAQSFASQMENMLNQLMSSAEEFTYNDMFADMDAINSAVDTSDKLLKQEKSLLAKTEKMDKALTDAREKAMQEKINRFKKKVRMLAGLLRKKFYDLKKNSLEHSKFRNLITRELFQAEKKLASLLQNLDTDLNMAQSQSKEITKRMKNLSSRIDTTQHPLSSKTKETHMAAQAITSEFDQLMKQSEQMSAEDSQRMAEMAKNQENIREGTRGLQDMLSKLDGAEAFLGQEVFDTLESSMEGMKKAGEGLQGGNMPSSLSGERDAANNLSKVAEQLKKFQQDAQQMMKMGKGGKISMKGFSPGRIGGRIIRGKVDIPTKDDHKVPSKLRDDILKAMRGGSPKKYKEMNSHYYNELIR